MRKEKIVNHRGRKGGTKISMFKSKSFFQDPARIAGSPMLSDKLTNRFNLVMPAGTGLATEWRHVNRKTINYVAEPRRGGMFKI